MFTLGQQQYFFYHEDILVKKVKKSCHRSMCALSPEEKVDESKMGNDINETENFRDTWTGDSNKAKYEIIFDEG